MEHLAQIIFYINLAWMMTHELDAIHHHEWRILPLTSWMDEIWSYRIFVVAHIPLFALMMTISRSYDFQIIFDLFVVFHVGLHWLFRNHPENTFDNLLSRILIVGGIPIATLHLLLILIV